jgi:DNA invertase Pin-like site-specific DNA recombinase
MELISYLRVSTARQGNSGLGLEAQRAKVQELAASRGAVLVAEFVEVESGRKNERPQLALALEEARKRTGAVIVVAKLDRLARDAEFVLRLSREAAANGMGGFLFADLPDVDATTSTGRMVLTVMASVAEFEAARISERTKEALAAAKARGVKLGGDRGQLAKANAAAKQQATEAAEKLRSLFELMVKGKYSYRQMSEMLAKAGHLTSKGNKLSPTQVQRYLLRLGLSN